MKKRRILRIEKLKEPKVFELNQGKGLESSKSSFDEEIDPSFEKEDKIAYVWKTI